MAYTYTPLSVARDIDPVLADSKPVLWGTGSDVGQEFDGTLLRFFDSGDESRLTLDPATSTMELVFPTATSPAESPILRLYHDEDGSTQAPADTIGQIDFATQNDDGTKMAYTRISSKFGWGGASEELGVLSFSVLSRGDMTEMFTIAGDTLGLGVDAITANTSIKFGVTGKALLVGPNEAAFRYSAGLSAGLFFVTNSPDGFEFRNALGAIVGKIMSFGGGGLRVPNHTVAANTGLDTLTAGALNIAPAVATSVRLCQGLTILDAKDITVNATTGTKIGTAVTQKLGFWNKTPVVQPAGAAQAALTNSTGGTADGTLAAISGTGDDAGINNNFTELHTLLDAIRTGLVNAGLIKGAA